MKPAGACISLYPASQVNRGNGNSTETSPLVKKLRFVYTQIQITYPYFDLARCKSKYIKHHKQDKGSKFVSILYRSKWRIFEDVTRTSFPLSFIQKICWLALVSHKPDKPRPKCDNNKTNCCQPGVSANPSDSPSVLHACPFTFHQLIFTTWPGIISHCKG